jgi:hypothetical protein
MKKQRAFPTWFHGLPRKKLKRVFSLLAAFLVLALFVVKDGLREQFKSLSDAIDNAENYHEAQAFNRLLIHDVRTVGQGIDEISNTISMNEVLRQNPHPDWADLPEPQNTREFFEEDACTEAERLLREAERLLQTAGAAPSQQKTLTDLRARLVKAQAITGPSAPPPGSTKAALQEYALKKGAVFFIIRDHALSVTEDTNKFLAALLPDAEAKRKRNDEIYRTLTFVTYGLFGLGWCVGVARVLTDDQDDDTDEL